MDTETRHALKKDNFAEATASGVSWLSEHRSGVVRWVIAAVVAVVVIVAAAVTCDLRSSAADKALGAGVDLYNTPLAEAGAPVTAGEYTTAQARADYDGADAVIPAQPVQRIRVTQLILRVTPPSSHTDHLTAVPLGDGWLVFQL